MTAIRWKFVCGLAALLTASPAVADTVVTAEEVISCSVVSASADSVRLTLAQGKSRTLPTRDVYEVRLSDTARVAELAVLVPRAKVVLDSGQPVPPPEVRAREVMRLRLDRARESRAESLPGHADVVDTLARNAAPAVMAARCREMDAVLRECGRSDDTVFYLLREINREQEAIRGIWARWRTGLCLAGGGVPGGTGGGCIGFSVGEDIRPTEAYTDCMIGPESHFPSHCDLVVGGGPVGFLVGFAAGYVGGSLAGAAVGSGWRAALVANHRGRVNDLVRRVNRAVASPP
jgi:hypothetical protein